MTVTLVILLVLIGLSIPVGAALGILGLILDPLYSMLPLTRAIGEIAWQTNNEFLLVAIPLFIMLGEILLRSGIAEKMYSAMSLWLSWLPGGLMHANIAASTNPNTPTAPQSRRECPPRRGRVTASRISAEKPSTMPSTRKLP